MSNIPPTMAPCTSLALLPQNHIEHIFTFLDVTNICASMMVCKSLSKNDQPKLWRLLYIRQNQAYLDKNPNLPFPIDFKSVCIQLNLLKKPLDAPNLTRIASAKGYEETASLLDSHGRSQTLETLYGTLYARHSSIDGFTLFKAATGAFITIPKEGNYSISPDGVISRGALRHIKIQLAIPKT